MRIVVTGAGTGGEHESLGFAVCRRFTELGHDVIGWDLTPARLDEARGALPSLATQVVDIADAGSIESACGSLEGIPDVLVNCAAMTRHTWAYRAIEQVSVEQLETELSVTYLGTCYATLLAARMMAGQRSGSIVNVSSSIYSYPGPFQIGYAASKAAIAQLTRALAGELIRDGIRINAVAPALVRTSVYEALSDRSRDRILGLYGDPTPLDPAEVARVVSYLALGEGADAITGQVITLDRGFFPFPANRAIREGGGADVT